MKPSAKNIGLALGVAAIGLAIAAAGIYIGETDDAPGAALVGILMALAAMMLTVKMVRRGMRI